MTTQAKHVDQIGYVAEKFTTAFYASRNIVGDFTMEDGESGTRATAVYSGARLSLADETGSDLTAACDVATDRLAQQGFRPEIIAAFVDVIREDAAHLAFRQRAVAP